MKILMSVFVATSLLFVTGCNKPTENPSSSEKTTNVSVASNVVDAKVGERIFDITGKQYIKLTNEKTNANGSLTADVWERVGETRSWYTPTLDSKLNKDKTPMFNSLARLPGETFPTTK